MPDVEVNSTYKLLLTRIFQFDSQREKNATPKEYMCHKKMTNDTLYHVCYLSHSHNPVLNSFKTCARNFNKSNMILPLLEQVLVFCAVFCGSLLSYFFWPLYCWQTSRKPSVRLSLPTEMQQDRRFQNIYRTECPVKIDI